MPKASKKNLPTGERYTEALLEDLHHQFKAFGEGLESLSEQVVGVQDQLKGIEHRLDTEFSIVRKELTEVKSLLGTKADRARLEALEARVDRLERAVQPQ